MVGQVSRLHLDARWRWIHDRGTWNVCRQMTDINLQEDSVKGKVLRITIQKNHDVCGCQCYIYQYVTMVRVGCGIKVIFILDGSEG